MRDGSTAPANESNGTVRRRRTGRWLAPVALCLLSACASLPRPVGERVYAGRFALTTSLSDQRRDSLSGRFALAVSAGAVILDLGTPLGSAVARVETGPEGASLSVPADGGLRVTRGADAERLSEQVLGWRVPISGLPDWIEGRPAAGLPYRLARADDGAELIEQDGWTVRIEQRGADGRVERLRLDRPPDADGPGVALRVILDAGTP